MHKHIICRLLLKFTSLYIKAVKHTLYRVLAIFPRIFNNITSKIHRKVANTLYCTLLYCRIHFLIELKPQNINCLFFCVYATFNTLYSIQTLQYFVFKIQHTSTRASDEAGELHSYSPSPWVSQGRCFENRAQLVINSCLIKMVISVKHSCITSSSYALVKISR